MKTFFRKLGAFLSGLRTWTVNLITLLLLIYLVVAIGMLLVDQPGTVDPEGKVLIIAPEGMILDQETFPEKLLPPFANFPESDQVQTRDLVEIIRAAAADDRLAAVLIDFSNAAFAGPSTALLLAQELAALRESGKPLIAYSESLTTASYMLAAQADEIYVHPSGGVAISGLGGYRDYTRELTDKLKIDIHNYSQGDFKSAVEGLTRRDMSEPDKLQRRELYGPIWARMKQQMAGRRGLDPALFQSMADNYPAPLINEAAYDTLAYAEQQGIIDGARNYPEFRAWMIERFGKAEDEDRDTYPHIAADVYRAQLEPEIPDTEDAVAVVFVQGGIQPGPEGPGVAGSDDIAALLREACEDENNKALVLRVNSPGGSIIASDIIRDELVAAKARGLPVLVSMGDVAASGGVWVATPADAIYAEPATITGSIGVAVAFPTFEKLFNHIGINFDGVTTSEHAAWNVFRGVDEKLDAVFARWAGSAYDRFVNTVAADRDKDPDYIRSIAGGRVWISGRARELGLIDELGTMEDTISEAASRAGLEQYRVNYVVKEVPPHIVFLREFSAGISGQVSYPWRAFGQRMETLLEALEGINQPTATVMCTECMVEIL